MFRRLVWWIVLLLPANAQQRQPVPAATAAVLQAMAARAGVIFAGSVLQVQRHDAAGYVDVTFAVEHAVRGVVHAGNSTPRYELREWAGLWTGGDRYRVGQRVLILLAGRGPQGMSAPVGGMAGVIPLIATRKPPIWRQGAATADTRIEDDADELVDLRWVETQVATRFLRVRAASHPGTAAATQTPSLTDVLALLAEAGAN